jgi:hypothetical protein
MSAGGSVNLDFFLDREGLADLKNFWKVSFDQLVN